VLILIYKGKPIDAQQLHDHIIKPTLEYMGGNYNSKNARFLLLCTAAIESNCGYYIKQVNGPALGIWQMEPTTHDDIWSKCDALLNGKVISGVMVWACDGSNDCIEDLIVSPRYACAMARLKYSMDIEPLPDHNDFRAVYREYKRIYNTPLGASTYEKFKQACVDNKVFEVVL